MMDFQAIDWRSLRALRSACGELTDPASLEHAYARIREAESKIAQLKARPDYDPLEHRVATPGVDGPWHHLMIASVRSLAASMNVADRLPPPTSELWSASWSRKPDDLPLVRYARELIGTADFLLGAFTAAADES